MKNLKLIIIAATCFLSFNLLSQNGEKNDRIVKYGYFGLEGGYINGLEVSYFAPSITLGFKKGFEFSVDYKNFDAKNPNLENYYLGIPLLVNVYEGNGTNVNVTSFNFGKSIYSSKKMRVVFSAGPSYSQYSGYESSGYTFFIIGGDERTEIFSDQTIGVDVKTKIDFTAAEVLGASLILNANFNEFSNYYGAGLSFNFGKIK